MFGEGFFYATENHQRVLPIQKRPATLVLLILSGLKKSMKQVALLILITSVISCSKRTNDYSAMKMNIVDKWEIRESYGGWGGTSIFQPGNGFIIEFKSDNSFVRYNKDTVVQAGSYDLQSSTEKDQYKVTFYTNGNEQHEDIISLKGDTLVFLPQCCDIPGATYVRIK